MGKYCVLEKEIGKTMQMMRKASSPHSITSDGSGVGPDGIVTKLQRIQTGIDYLLIAEEIHTASEELFHRAEVTKLALKNWSSTLSKEERKRQVVWSSRSEWQ